MKGLASTDILIIEKGKRSEIRDFMLSMDFIGPSFFHFAMGAFLSYPQRRAEDPVFARRAFLDRLAQFGLQYIIDNYSHSTRL